MYLRKNALLGAARMIEAVDAIGQKHQPGVATVGLIENKPNSRNVVPGEVFFTIDLRHPDEEVLDSDGSRSSARRSKDILPPMKLTYEEKRIWNSPAVKFAPELIDCVRHGAEKAGFAMRDMVSGAGHDAAYIARVAPTTMIFVPCEGGLSPQRGGIDQLRGMRRRRAGAAQRGSRARSQVGVISWDRGILSCSFLSCECDLRR